MKTYATRSGRRFSGMDISTPFHPTGYFKLELQLSCAIVLLLNFVIDYSVFESCR